MQSRIRRIAAFALIVLSSIAAVGPARAAGEEPDLKLELIGIAPGNPREVQFKVTNVSDWWADETTARFETVSPGASSPKAGILVENLDPKQSTIVTYLLAAPCDGHVVKGEVAAAKNYAGVAETNLGNNRFNDPKPVCPAHSGLPTDAGVISKPPGADPGNASLPIELGIETKPGGIDSAAILPEYQRPGTHELVFEASAARTVIRFDNGSVGALEGKDCCQVGFFQHEATGLGGADQTRIMQTAVAFNLTMLEDTCRQCVSKAILNFVEEESVWTNGDGDREEKVGCVSTLGLATAPWGAPTPVPDGVFPNDVYTTSSPLAASQHWDVTGPVQRLVDFPDTPSYRYGFVLRSPLDYVDGDDDTSCESKLTSIRLFVTYSVVN